MLNSYPEQMLSPFLNTRVVIETYAGQVEGVLKGWGPSMHGGYGPLIVQEGNNFILVIRWRMIIKKGE